MTDTYSRLHGTTVDRFKVGQKNQKITQTGTTVGAVTAILLDRDNTRYTANSTTFFTANIIGQGNNIGAFEVKGCYVSGQSGVSGTVINTYIDNSDLGIVQPSVNFDINGAMSITVTGIANDTITWTAIIEFIQI
jgi:hypothetical protein